METVNIGQHEENSRKELIRRSKAAHALANNEEEFNKRKELSWERAKNRKPSDWSSALDHDVILMEAAVIRSEKAFYEKHGRERTMMEFFNMI